MNLLLSCTTRFFQTFRVVVYQFVLPLKPSVHFSEIALLNLLKFSRPDFSTLELWKKYFWPFLSFRFYLSTRRIKFLPALHKYHFWNPEGKLFFFSLINNHHKQFPILDLSESNGSLPRVPGFKACDYRCSSFWYALFLTPVPPALPSLAPLSQLYRIRYMKSKFLH